MSQTRECSQRRYRLSSVWGGLLVGVLAFGLVPVTATAHDPEAEAKAAAAEAAAKEAEAAADKAEAAASQAESAAEAAAEATEEAAEATAEQAEVAAEATAEAVEVEAAATPEPAPAAAPAPAGLGLVQKDGRATKLQVSLNDDGSLYLRFAAWLQVWARAMELNPGTTVLGNADDWYGDVAIRRARFLVFGKIFPKTTLLMHFGVNNQSFRNARKPQLYVHDAWAEFEAVEKKLSIGAGLLYWNGISRMTNASTITFMSLDAPISNWPTIERTDQFARQMGVYAKGKLGGFDYRVAVVRPFSTSVPDLTPGGPGNYNNAANTFGYSGYFQYQFWDEESNTLPYAVGTYIGKKRVLNIGAGFHVQPKGIAEADAGGAIDEKTLIIGSADFFVDAPIKRNKKHALTAYAAYYYMDFGRDALRNIGIMNPADPGSGGGNAYPTLGTGHTGYMQLGWLLPCQVNDIRFQPYVLSQISGFDALNDPMIQYGIGINMFLHGHNAKITLQYQDRPIFDTAGDADSRGSEFVLQMHLFI